MMNIMKFADKTKLFGIFKIFLVVMTFLSIFVAPSATAQSTGTNTVLCALISMYNTIDSAIFIIALVLMLLGGALYAGAHMMPGTTKGSLQGYGMGMILGGVIGVIIAIMLPYIFQLITGFSASNIITSSSQSIGCPSS